MKVARWLIRIPKLSTIRGQLKESEQTAASGKRDHVESMMGSMENINQKQWTIYPTGWMKAMYVCKKLSSAVIQEIEQRQSN